MSHTSLPVYIAPLPPADATSATPEGRRIAGLLRQAAHAIAAPHLVADDLWRPDDESLSAAALVGALDAAARLAEAAHVTADSRRRSYSEITGYLALYIALG